MDKIIAGLKKKIVEIIKKSSNPEDPLRAKNTLEWMIKLEPQTDEALKIVALGHDIERAISKRKIKRENYTNYEEFKKAHALNSTEVLSKLMETFGARICQLIFHEIKGNKKTQYKDVYFENKYVACTSPAFSRIYEDTERGKLRIFYNKIESANLLFDQFQ